MSLCATSLSPDATRDMPGQAVCYPACAVAHEKCATPHFLPQLKEQEL